MAIDQGESWVNLGGNGTVNPQTGHGLIGQIFFGTAEASLDDNDLYQTEMLTVGIKEYLAEVVGMHRLKPFTFSFIGLGRPPHGADANAGIGGLSGSWTVPAALAPRIPQPGGVKRGVN